MADKNIGALPAAPDLYDDSLLVAEQQGAAVKITGKQWKGYAQKAVAQYSDAARLDAEKTAADRIAIENMTVSSATLSPGSAATVQKSTVNGVVNLTFGIPAGQKGEKGDEGKKGDTGPQGPQGPAGNLMYASFFLDPDSGSLLMLSDQNYAGPSFRLSGADLEVVFYHGS